MIKPFCYKCRLELIRPGGILFSPPLDDRSIGDKHEYLDSVFKFHLCLECYNKVFSFISKYEENIESIGYSKIGT